MSTETLEYMYPDNNNTQADNQNCGGQSGIPCPTDSNGGSGSGWDADNTSDVIGGVLATIGSIFGGGANAANQQPVVVQQDNTPIYIGMALLALLIIVTIVIVVKFS